MFVNRLFLTSGGNCSSGDWRLSNKGMMNTGDNPGFYSPLTVLYLGAKDVVRRVAPIPRLRFVKTIGAILPA